MRHDISTIDGFSNTKGDPNYWLDTVRDFWAETELDTDEIELCIIVKWFDERRKVSTSVCDHLWHHMPCPKCGKMS